MPKGGKQRARTLYWDPGRPAGEPRQGEGEEGAESRGTGATETCELGRGRGGAGVKGGQGVGEAKVASNGGGVRSGGAWPGGWAAGTRQGPRCGGGRGGGRGEGGRLVSQAAIFCTR